MFENFFKEAFKNDSYMSKTAIVLFGSQKKAREMLSPVKLVSHSTLSHVLTIVFAFIENPSEAEILTQLSSLTTLEQVKSHLSSTNYTADFKLSTILDAIQDDPFADTVNNGPTAQEQKNIIKEWYYQMLFHIAKFKLNQVVHLWPYVCAPEKLNTLNAEETNKLISDVYQSLLSFITPTNVRTTKTNNNATYEDIVSVYTKFLDQAISLGRGVDAMIIVCGSVNPVEKTDIPVFKRSKKKATVKELNTFKTNLDTYLQTKLDTYTTDAKQTPIGTICWRMQQTGSRIAGDFAQKLQEMAKEGPGIEALINDYLAELETNAAERKKNGTPVNGKSQIRMDAEQLMQLLVERNKALENGTHNDFTTSIVELKDAAADIDSSHLNFPADDSISNGPVTSDVVANENPSDQDNNTSTQSPNTSLMDMSTEEISAIRSSFPLNNNNEDNSVDVGSLLNLNENNNDTALSSINLSHGLDSIEYIQGKNNNASVQGSIFNKLLNLDLSMEETLRLILGYNAELYLRQVPGSIVAPWIEGILNVCLNLLKDPAGINLLTKISSLQKYEDVPTVLEETDYNAKNKLSEVFSQIADDKNSDAQKIESRKNLMALRYYKLLFELAKISHTPLMQFMLYANIPVTLNTLNAKQTDELLENVRKTLSTIIMANRRASQNSASRELIQFVTRGKLPEMNNVDPAINDIIEEYIPFLNTAITLGRGVDAISIVCGSVSHVEGTDIPDLISGIKNASTEELSTFKNNLTTYHQTKLVNYIKEANENDNIYSKMLDYGLRIAGDFVPKAQAMANANINIHDIFEDYLDMPIDEETQERLDAAQLTQLIRNHKAKSNEKNAENTSNDDDSKNVFTHSESEEDEDVVEHNNPEDPNDSNSPEKGSKPPVDNEDAIVPNAAPDRPVFSSQQKSGEKFCFTDYSKELAWSSSRQITRARIDKLDSKDPNYQNALYIEYEALEPKCKTRQYILNKGLKANHTFNRSLKELPNPTILPITRMLLSFVNDHETKFSYKLFTWLDKNLLNMDYSTQGKSMKNREFCIETAGDLAQEFIRLKDAGEFKAFLVKTVEIRNQLKNNAKSILIDVNRFIEIITYMNRKIQAAFPDQCKNENSNWIDNEAIPEEHQVKLNNS